MRSSVDARHAPPARPHTSHSHRKPTGDTGAPDTIVRIVDDDPAMLRSMALLLETAGFRVSTYDSGEAFLRDRHRSPGCAVLDLHMSGAGGLEVQQAILESDDPLPVIFLTGRGDVHSSVAAMKRGAVDFLTKPVSGDELLDAVRRAIAVDQAARRDRRERAELRARYGALTPRERETFTLIARGLLNKQIAAALGTSERTVKAHRANVMRKMRAASVADLARAADRLDEVALAGQ